MSRSTRACCPKIAGAAGGDHQPEINFPTQASGASAHMGRLRMLKVGKTMGPVGEVVLYILRGARGASRALPNDETYSMPRANA